MTWDRNGTLNLASRVRKGNEVSVIDHPLPYISYRCGADTVMIDGEITIGQLDELLAFMKAHVTK